MGFGIALIGYCFMIMGDFGGAIFAAPLLAYGFFLASRLEKNFLNAAVSSLFLLPRGIYIIVYSFINYGKAEQSLKLMQSLNLITFLIFQLAWLLTSYFWLTAVINIANECNSPMIYKRAKRTMNITLPYIILSAAATFLNSFGLLGIYAGAMSTIMFILMYVVIIINLVMLHTCFVLITSERQYQRDKQQLAKERADALKKAEEDRKEEAKRLEDRKNK